MKKKNYLFILSILMLTVAFGASAQNHKSFYGYTENKGQIRDQSGNARDDVRFMFADETFKVILRNDGFSYEWIRSNYKKDSNPESGIVEISDDENGVKDYPVQFINNRVDINFLNANKNPEIISEGTSPYYFNYFNGYTGNEGIKRVRNFEKVTYKNIYNGIDLVFSSEKNTEGITFPKYEFVVHPSGNISNIALSYNGADDISISKEGTLDLKVPLGTVSETQPIILFNDGTAASKGNFVQHGNILSFASVKRDKNATIIIDPTIEWGTYWGGTQKDLTDEITTDLAGNCFVTGRVRSNTLFATAGAYQTVNHGGLDIPLMKWAPDGNLVYATYYGGSSNEIGFCIITDPQQNVWIGGHTFSPDGIATPDAMQTFFVPGAPDDYDGNLSKFTNDGDLVYGTYFGGVGQDELQNIWADTDGS
ncbi:MAG: hypothetical protein LH473_06775, partial [Chitinophagales bacterium]|nr:hypothetical protein [Chitinophagales bacterium]